MTAYGFTCMRVCMNKSISVSMFMYMLVALVPENSGYATSINIKAEVMLRVSGSC